MMHLYCGLGCLADVKPMMIFIKEEMSLEDIPPAFLVHAHGSCMMDDRA